MSMAIKEIGELMFVSQLYSKQLGQWAITLSPIYDERDAAIKIVVECVPLTLPVRMTKRQQDLVVGVESLTIDGDSSVCGSKEKIQGIFKGIRRALEKGALKATMSGKHLVIKTQKKTEGKKKAVPQ